MSRRLRLAVFDLDGVLVIERSSWGYLHKVFGTYELVDKAGYAKDFERGLITYSDWMRLDLENIIRARGTVLCRQIIEAFEEVEIAEGAREVVTYLKSRGVATAIVSAGIEFLATRIASYLGIDEVYANKLLCDEEGKLLPRGVEVVNPLKKGEVIKEIARKHRVDLLETMYVGDSEWDCSAFEVVGYPVALSSTPIKCGKLLNSTHLVYVSNMKELESLIKNILP
ncbi:MAG: HAD-IB family phosphatase [Sulfolobales archaeon]